MLERTFKLVREDGFEIFTEGYLKDVIYPVWSVSNRDHEHVSFELFLESWILSNNAKELND